jgi:hypothetical protein
MNVRGRERMAHSIYLAVGDEEGVPGSDVRLTVRDGDAAQRRALPTTGKSKDQRMPLGRFHRPKTKATQLWKNLSLPK